MTGAELLVWRTRRGWSQTTAAQALNTSLSTLKRAEKDAGAPLGKALCKAMLRAMLEPDAKAPPLGPGPQAVILAAMSTKTVAQGDDDEKALNAIREVVSDPDAEDRDRLTGAKALLDHARKTRISGGSSQAPAEAKPALDQVRAVLEAVGSLCEPAKAISEDAVLKRMMERSPVAQ